MKIAFVVGTRPNFVKVAPLIEVFKKAGIDIRLIHTGQHFDFEMSQAFFKDLKIPKPNINLGINSETPQDLKQITSVKISRYFQKEKPGCVVVVGDSDATCAGAMAAKNTHIKLAHVEAGLRSFYMAMPEEVNRLYIDKVADYLFVSEPSGLKNLKDSKAKGKMFFVGNVMVDTLVNNLPTIKAIKPKYPKQTYALVTLHRKSNIHAFADLKKSIDLINYVAEKYVKLVFPTHPRTKNNLLKENIKLNENIDVIDPQSYLDFQSLIYNSQFVLTDSGGLQDETTFYGKPCLTLRYNTERPITYRVGTSVIVGLDKQLIDKNITKIMAGKFKKGRTPKYWDGKAAERIVTILKKEYDNNTI